MAARPAYGRADLGVRERRSRSRESRNHVRHFAVADRVRGVLGHVIVRVTVERGISDHDARIPLPPEGQLIAQRDPRYPRRTRERLGRKIRVLAKRAAHAPQSTPGTEVRDEADEVAGAWVKQA